MWRVLGWVFFTGMAYLLGAEVTSRLLFGSDFLVDEGSNNLSDSQDWVVLLWPVWLSGLLFSPFLVWGLVKLVKVLKPRFSASVKWTTRHVGYVSWKESPGRWVSSLLAGRKQDRLPVQVAATVERDARTAERVVLDRQREKAELKRRQRRNRDRPLVEVLAELEREARTPERVALDKRRKEEEIKRRQRRWKKRVSDVLQGLSPEERLTFEELSDEKKKVFVAKHEQKRRLEKAARERDAWQGPLQQAVRSELRSGVRARIPKDADDFESASAEWVQTCGVDARRTPKGPDGGLDLVGPSFAGQCKFHPSNKVGAPDVQQLAGAAAQAQKSVMAFFHYGPGYTPAAIEAARSLGVQLWEMDVDQHTFRKVD